jgi:ferrous iron transport protein B
MHEHTGKVVLERQKYPEILLVGNPNVGKSLVFGILTGKYVTVSNYPGTTVEVTEGVGTVFGKKHTIIDTPGVNSLSPMSEDERVTRDIILEHPDSTVVQVADAKNIDRALHISIQLAEFDRKFILVLNMADEAKRHGISIDTEKLQKILGINVFLTVATRKKGFNFIHNSAFISDSQKLNVEYPAAIKNAAEEIAKLLPPEVRGRYGIAIMLICGDETLREWLHKKLPESVIKAIENIREELQKNFSQPLNYVVNKSRLRTIQNIMSEVFEIKTKRKWDSLEKMGEIVMHPLWGVPVLLGVLVLIYYFVGVFGAQTLVDFFENTIFNTYIVPWGIKAIDFLFPFPHEHITEGATQLPDYTVPSTVTLSGIQKILQFIHDLLIGPQGIISIAVTYSLAIVLPIVTTFFIAFGLLEDSGYLPRLAVMLNRIFRLFGLSGKAVLPMMLGLGCDTMATITTRILDSKKERIIVTLLLALGIPCSAQLGVILGMLAGLSFYATLIWTGVICGVIVFVGFLASIVIPGRGSDFIVEVPPLRIPQLENILVKTLARLEWYVKEAVPLFILGTFLLFILDKLALLTAIQNASAPVVQRFLELPAQTTEAFVVGFLRRDYGAAGLYALAEKGMLTHQQIVVSLVTITLFVPCVANFFIIIKERGWKTAMAVVLFIFPFAFLVGGILNMALNFFKLKL